jgi:hypothetical protein
MYSQFVSKPNAILFRIRSLGHVELEQDFSSHSNTSNIILSRTRTRLYFELGRNSKTISVWTGKQFCFELERNFMSISSNAIWFRIRTPRTTSKTISFRTPTTRTHICFMSNPNDPSDPKRESQFFERINALVAEVSKKLEHIFRTPCIGYRCNVRIVAMFLSLQFSKIT